MKAITCSRYGGPEVLQVTELPKPTPKPGEVLIKVRATTVTSGDWRVRSMNVPSGFGTLARLALGLSGPRQPILGTELAGDIEAVGAQVTDWKVGDAVFAFCGAKMGCYAEYKCIPAQGMLARKPANLTYEQAAALSFGGTTALDFFRRGKLQSGEKLLINGASGGVGTAAIQIAKHMGAEITAVCSAANAQLVRSLGADHVIDYTQQDFVKSGATYDVIMDTAGTAPLRRCRPALKAGGRLLLVLAGMGDTLGGLWASMTSPHKVIAGPASELLADLHTLSALAEAGALTPPIDRSYTLDQIVEAHRYVDQGHKKGNVVITM
jgi:NADPH:quinone reductase-like Zn-dependent oxidoreductase